MNKKEHTSLRKQWGFKEPWIAVDLDHTLARCTTWKGYNHIGRPIPRMVRRVLRWLGQGKQVKIFTSRVEGGPAAIRAIHRWLEENGLPRLEVTNVKDSGIVEMWDDIAIKVRGNTGRTCCPYKKNWKVKIVY